MKFNKQLLSLLFVSYQIKYSNAETVITDEAFKTFEFGPREFRLAVIGDSGVSPDAKKVMGLSYFDVLLHLGDYDYTGTPTNYLKTMLDTSKYQFMGILGDNDTGPKCTFEEYHAFKNGLYNEMKKNDCVFSPSKCMWSCKYDNLRIIGLTPDINDCDAQADQLSFLKEHLQNSKEDWKICAWHFYDKYYHTGHYQEHDYDIVSNKSESFYDYCKENGAIIFSAHDNVYARTHVMSNFADRVIDQYDTDSNGKVVQIRNGATFNILNGAGGGPLGIEQGVQKDYNHWQKKYAKGKGNKNENAFGAVFCDFNVGGNNKKAYCEFQRINSVDEPYDSFDIYRNDNPGTIKYTQIDIDYKNEKMKAYKEKYNLTDSEVIDKTTNPLSNVIDNKNKEKNKNNSNSSNTAKICLIVGGSLFVALLIFGGGYIMKKRKAIQDDKKIEMKSPFGKHDDSFSFIALPENGQYNTSGTVKRSGTIDSSFAPLPAGNNFYESKSTYSNSGKSNDKQNQNSYSEFSYYDVKNELKNHTIDVEPLVSPQQKRINKDYNSYLYDDNDNYRYNDGGRSPGRKYSRESFRSDDDNYRYNDGGRSPGRKYSRESFRSDDDDYRYNDGGRSPGRKYSRESFRDDDYYSKPKSTYSQSRKIDDDDDGPKVGASRYRISQKHEPSYKPNREVKSILKNRDYVPYGTLSKPKDGDTSTSSSSKDRSFDPLIKDFNAHSRNKISKSPRVYNDNPYKEDYEYYKYR